MRFTLLIVGMLAFSAIAYFVTHIMVENESSSYQTHTADTFSDLPHITEQAQKT
jgi:hypothetical protein